MSEKLSTTLPPNISEYFEGGKRGAVLWAGDVFKKNRNNRNDNRVMVVTGTGVFLFKKAQLRRSVGYGKILGTIEVPDPDKRVVINVLDQHFLVVELRNAAGLMFNLREGYRQYTDKELPVEQVHRESGTLEEMIVLKKRPGWANDPNEGLAATSQPISPSPRKDVTIVDPTPEDFQQISADDHALPGPHTPPLDARQHPSGEYGLLGTAIPQGSPVLTSRRTSPRHYSENPAGVGGVGGSYHDAPMGRGRGRGVAHPHHRSIPAPMPPSAASVPTSHAQSAHFLRQKGASLMSPKRPPVMSFEEGSWGASPISIPPPLPPIQGPMYYDSTAGMGGMVQQPMMTAQYPAVGQPGAAPVSGVVVV